MFIYQVTPLINEIYAANFAFEYFFFSHCNFKSIKDEEEIIFCMRKKEEQKKKM